ncbi:hypothetical protein DFH11DRAFT_1808680 [Phellopilus nigrolimitatus]|nr:hypothetical protein DFH11DRAFT_1808680 [Phellopilus nigrolimitatus]
MPEGLETEAHHQYIKNIKKLFEATKEDPELWKVLGLWADGAKSDVQAAKEKAELKNSSLAQGYVWKMNSHCTMARGNNNAQAPLWPPVWESKASAETDEANLSTLILKDVESSGRSLIFDFSGLHLMFQFLTHTSVQFYSLENWYKSIVKVPCDERKFKIGLAMEFGHTVLAFPTIDLVFQPTWVRSRVELGTLHVDILKDRQTFLQNVTNWIADRYKQRTNRDRLACEIMRETGEVWTGVGVYTVCELFYIAAKRICRDLVKGALKSDDTALFKSQPLKYIYAPSTAQRLKYNKWLHNILDACTHSGADWIRREEPKLVDTFEPTYLIEPLRLLQENLGHLIFGKERWLHLGGSMSLQDDPLTLYFRKRGLLDGPTFLCARADAYSPLFLEKSETEGLAQSKRLTYLYKAKKQIWSITKCFPPSSTHGLPMKLSRWSSVEITPFSMEEKKKMTFRYVVEKTQKVAIGPLEYCGHADIVKKQGGKGQFIAVCRADPSLPDFYTAREKRSRERREKKYEKEGKPRPLATSRLGNSGSGIDSGAGSCLIVKKRRISADKVVASGVEPIPEGLRKRSQQHRLMSQEVGKDTQP